MLWFILYFTKYVDLEGKEPLPRTRRRWEGNVKIVILKMEFHDVKWIHLRQDREGLCDFVSKVKKFWFPKNQANEYGCAL